MTAVEGGGIFISYRRQETSHLAGRLYDRLIGRFGEGQVFIDVDAIEPGVDFAEEIFRAVAARKVLLAIIGPAWLTAADERGRRRLDDPDDIVRLEIEAALARRVRVIPILVEGAVMPVRDDLPESLVGLARRNALLIRHESFRYDAGRLVAAIERALAASGTDTASTAPGARPGDDDVGEVSQKGSEPPRTDVSGVARLLADAERIAESITYDQSDKAIALSSVAKAVAATDPDRAARIVTDAERIANSIPYEFEKAIALISVAEAVAATDPDRAARIVTEAERITNSITYDQSDKDQALISVAGAVAAIHPDRAERLANSVSERSWKISALSGVAEALAATDPDRAARLLTDAERITNSITDDQYAKAIALSDIAEAAAAIDPDRAARLLTDAERAASFTNEFYKASALNGVARAVAATDPDRAERIANSITDKSAADKSAKAMALSSVAEALAATDPDRAARLLTDAKRIANSITITNESWKTADESWKAAALRSVVKALAATSS